MKKILLLMSLLGFSLINCDVTLNIQNDNDPADLTLRTYRAPDFNIEVGQKVISLNPNESKTVVITNDELPYSRGSTWAIATTKSDKSKAVEVSMLDGKSINVQIAKKLSVSIS